MSTKEQEAVRTTVVLPYEVWFEAKTAAATAPRGTMGALIETALREHLRRKRRSDGRRKTR